jgi:hypothetical protein
MFGQHGGGNEDEPRLTVGDVSSDGDRHGGRVAKCRGSYTPLLAPAEFIEAIRIPGGLCVACLVYGWRKMMSRFDQMKPEIGLAMCCFAERK